MSLNMNTKSKITELEEQVAALKKRVEDLEKRPATETHNHYHYPQPQYWYQTPWSQTPWYPWGTTYYQTVPCTADTGGNQLGSGVLNGTSLGGAATSGYCQTIGANVGGQVETYTATVRN